jgi:hypothetical protein
MAKAKFTYDDATQTVVAFPNDLVFDYDGKYVIALAGMADAAKVLTYLAQRGYDENMTNIAALDKDRKAKMLKDVPATDHEAHIAAWIDTRRAEKAAATLAGDFTVRKAVSRMSPLEKEIDKLAKALITTQCKAHNRPVPKGDDMAATVEKVLAVPAHRDRLQIEAQAALASAAELAAGVDITAMLTA